LKDYELHLVRIIERAKLAFTAVRSFPRVFTAIPGALQIVWKAILCQHPERVETARRGKGAAHWKAAQGKPLRL